MSSCCYMKGHVLSSLSHANVVYGDCFVFFFIYVLWKTEFQVVYIRLPALVCSILNVVDTVRTVKVLYSTSASVYRMCISVH